jgi:hypothetical protein
VNKHEPRRTCLDVLGAAYVHGTAALSPGEVVTAVDARLFAPYTDSKMDLRVPTRELTAG